MNFVEKEVAALIPIAVLKGGMYGVKIIAKIITKNGDTYFSFLIPPYYEINEKIEEYLVQAALAKYDYIEVQESTQIVSREELEEYLRLQNS